MEGVVWDIVAVGSLKEEVILKALGILGWV